MPSIEECGVPIVSSAVTRAAAAYALLPYSALPSADPSQMRAIHPPALCATSTAHLPLGAGPGPRAGSGGCAPLRPEQEGSEEEWEISEVSAAAAAPHLLIITLSQELAKQRSLAPRRVRKLGEEVGQPVRPRGRQLQGHAGPARPRGDALLAEFIFVRQFEQAVQRRVQPAERASAKRWEGGGGEFVRWL